MFKPAFRNAAVTRFITCQVLSALPFRFAHDSAYPQNCTRSYSDHYPAGCEYYLPGPVPPDYSPLWCKKISYLLFFNLFNCASEKILLHANFFRLLHHHFSIELGNCFSISTGISPAKIALRQYCVAVGRML